MRITQYKALGFSCYGTLVDRNRAILDALKPLLARVELHDSEAVLSRYRQLAVELRQHSPDISQLQLHCRLHERLARELEIPEDADSDWDLAMNFANRVSHWLIYEDVPGALQYLSKFYRLVMLMPADAGPADALTERLPVEFDARVIYQPDDRRRALADTLVAAGISREELLPVRSLEEDDPWRELVDFPICTLRRGQEVPWTPPAPTGKGGRCEYASLADLVLAHQDALRGG